MPRFSANLGFLWPELPLLARIDAAGRAGFKAVELHFPYDVPASEVKAACARNRVTLLGINTAVGTGSDGHRGLAAVPGREADFQALIDQSIAYAAAAGGNSVHAMAGLVPAKDRAAAAEVLVRNLREAAPKAAAQGLAILLEPLNQRDMPGYFYSEVEPAAEIIERVGAPNVKLMFDCYHVGCAQGDVVTRLKTLLNRIGHVQIAAVPSRTEPDDGEIAYPFIFRALDGLGYRGWVGCEYKPRGDTDAGLAWTRALGVSLEGGPVSLAERQGEQLTIDEEKAKQLFFEALDCIDRQDLAGAERRLLEASRLAPGRASILTNLGFVMYRQGRLEESYAYAVRATQMNMGDAEAWLLLGSTLIRLGRFAEAVAPLERAIALNPADADAQSGRGQALCFLGRYEEGAAAFDAALNINPGCRYVRGDLVTARLNVCQWSGLDEEFAKIREGLERSQPVVRPFQVLSMPVGALLQLRCAQGFAADEFAPKPGALWRGERYAHSRIRVAYVSPDFREHAVSYLTAGMFEHHDRKRFEVVGVSLTGQDQSPMGTRVTAAFEHFVDVRGRGGAEIAELIRNMETDILVDLAGVTQGSMAQIFSHRPAPVQVSYLGFPATMGSACFDYLIADPFVVPESSQRFYAEKIVTLPDVFQANDSRRPIGPRPARAEVGLPESGFVLCSFNSNYKILPEVFDIWMRLLKAVPGSVLWMVAVPAAQANLRAEAERRGVAAARLVFAERAGYEAHLGRFQLADLFLDTLPFNGGTTTSDALWAGVPVVTAAGDAYASRMAGSLLHAVGLLELITDNLGDYEALALDLATRPGRLAALREKLSANRLTSPLFDTARFTRHIEAAYIEMARRTKSGLPPETFSVPALA